MIAVLNSLSTVQQSWAGRIFVQRVIYKVSTGLLLVLFPLCLITISSSMLAAGSSAKSKVRINGNLPLTGPVAVFFDQYPNAFSMGIDDACKQYGVPREMFTLDFQDNGWVPSRAVSVMQKQMMDEPQVYISGGSPMSLAIAPEISKAGIPHLLVAFDAYICRNGANRLRFLPHYKIEAPVYIEYAKKQKAKRVFIVFPNNNSAYRDEFEKIVEPALSKSGIDYKSEVFDFDTKDYRTLALKAAQYKPDLIMIGAFSVQIYPMLSALRSYGLVKKDNLICTLDFIDLLHNGTPRSELVGIPFISPSCEVGADGELERRWAKRYQQKYGKYPTYVAAYAYETGRLVVAAYKKSGKVDSASIRSALPVHGMCGDINLDRDGDLDSKLWVAELDSAGKIKRIDQ
jgi:ABC-type branched-subunit amino acid transport system substrate-binding protein